MKTLNSFGGKGSEPEKTSMSGAQLTPYKGDARFMTVTDSYFAKNRLTGKVDQKDAEQLKNHYKFHKGTTYSIGTKGEGYDSGLNSLASNVKDAGDDNKDALADVSLKIQENANNIKQAGSDNKDGLALLGTHTETVASNIEQLATHVAIAGADNKDSLDALAGL